MDKPGPKNAFEGWMMAKMDTIELLFLNHLSHHKRMTYILLNGVLGLVIALLMK